MKRRKKAWIAVGLLAGAAALTGCSTRTAPTATPTTQAVQKETAQPQTAEPDMQAEASASPELGEEDASVPLALTVDGAAVESEAMLEHGMLLLPLIPVSKALGYETSQEEIEEQTQVRRSIALQKGESRITVSWVSSDNTARQITWQKDGLLVPVDAKLTTFENVVYVPAAFFEEACEVGISEGKQSVTITSKMPSDTPPMVEQDAQKTAEDNEQNS